MQPKVPDAASPDNFSNADPVDQTEDAAVPGNRGTVTQGTNTYEQINYEEKYRKAVHRCEIVLKELIFQKNFNEKTLNQNQNNNQTGCKAVKKMKKKESVISTLKKELSTAKKQNRWLKSKKCFNIRLKRKLKESSVNPSTASMIMTGRKRSRCYEKEDIAAAAILKSVSYKSYKILRKRKLLRLPSETTISRWLQEFRVDVGIQDSAIDVLVTKHAHVPKDIHCFLSFDEMQLKERWCYDKTNKCALLPGKKLLCVMARGLLTSWKTPVYFDVDQPMTKETINTIIASLEDRGFKVWGVSCDLGNQHFLSEVQFYDGFHYFPNPVDPARKVYIIPDVPHMLKLWRNHLFDKDFLFPKDPYSSIVNMPNEFTIGLLVEAGDWFPLNRGTFDKILKSDNGELKLNHKLTPMHINMPTGARTNVRMAAQTLSRTTAVTLQYLDPELALQAEALMTVNNVSFFYI